MTLDIKLVFVFENQKKAIIGYESSKQRKSQVEMN